MIVRHCWSIPFKADMVRDSHLGWAGFEHFWYVWTHEDMVGEDSRRYVSSWPFQGETRNCACKLGKAQKSLVFNELADLRPLNGPEGTLFPTRIPIFIESRAKYVHQVVQPINGIWSAPRQTLLFVCVLEIKIYLPVVSYEKTRRRSFKSNPRLSFWISGSSLSFECTWTTVLAGKSQDLCKCHDEYVKRILPMELDENLWVVSPISLLTFVLQVRILRCHIFGLLLWSLSKVVFWRAVCIERGENKR